MMLLKCPCCGSNRLQRKANDAFLLSISKKRSIRYIEETYHCADCNEFGDFANLNDSQYRKAKKIKDKQDCKDLIDSLREKLQCTDVWMERVLELPFGTFKAWERGHKIGATCLCLLKILEKEPWIVGRMEYINKFNLHLS